jgi:hypothetical protein
MVDFVGLKNQVFAFSTFVPFFFLPSGRGQYKHTPFDYSSGCSRSVAQIVVLRSSRGKYGPPRREFMCTFYIGFILSCTFFFVVFRINQGSKRDINTTQYLKK